MNLSICVKILLIFSSFALAGDWAIPLGRADYKWLKNASSAAELSLSGSGIASAQGLARVTQVPSAYSPKAGPELVVYHMIYPEKQGLSQNGIKLGLPWLGAGFWMDTRFLSSEELEGYDEWGNATGSFGAAAWNWGLGASFHHYVDFGFAVYWLHSQLENYSSSAWLGNASVQYEFPSQTHLGFTIGNLGGGTPYIDRSVIPPFFFQGGVSQELRWDLFVLTLHADFRYRNDEGESLPFGMSTLYADHLELRVGWDPLRESALPSAGLAVLLDWLRVEYGFAGHEYLGGTHLVQLGLDF